MRIRLLVAIATLTAGAVMASALPAVADSSVQLPPNWKCQAKTGTAYGDILDCRGSVAVKASKNPARAQWAKNQAVRAITAQADAAGLTLKTTPYPGCTWVKKNRWKCSAFWIVAAPAPSTSS